MWRAMLVTTTINKFIASDSDPILNIDEYEPSAILYLRCTYILPLQHDGSGSCHDVHKLAA